MKKWRRKICRFKKKTFFPGKKSIRRILDSCRFQKSQICPICVIITQNNAVQWCAVGENPRQARHPKDGGSSSLDSYQTFHFIITIHRDLTTIHHYTSVVLITCPSRAENVHLLLTPCLQKKKETLWTKKSYELLNVRHGDWRYVFTGILRKENTSDMPPGRSPA